MTIKQTAGKVLLSLYALQLDNPVKLEQSQILFIYLSKPKLEADKWLKDILHSITESDALLLNAFNYLLGKGLIANRNAKGSMGSLSLRGLHLTDMGIDVIEGVEQGTEGQKIVKSLFSFNFNANISLDSLLKAEVGNIVGVGAAVGGKADIRE